MSQTFSTLLQRLLEENAQLLATVDDNAVARVLDQLRNASRIFVTGEGRSGLVMRMFAMRLMHLGRAAFVVGDVTTPSIQAGDLLIVCSGSGETTIPCLRAERAKALGALIVVITGKRDSSLAKLAEGMILLANPIDADHSSANRTTQFGGSRFEQSAFLFCDALVSYAMSEWRVKREEMQGRHANLE